MVQYSPIDEAFAALSDPTRRGIVQHLAKGDASITDLARRFDMTLTGMKKHVRVLEEAGMVATVKVGRVRVCRLGKRSVDQEIAWLEDYRRILEERYDHLERFLEQKKGSR